MSHGLIGELKAWVVWIPGKQKFAAHESTATSPNLDAFSFAPDWADWFFDETVAAKVAKKFSGKVVPLAHADSIVRNK